MLADYIENFISQHGWILLCTEGAGKNTLDKFITPEGKLIQILSGPEPDNIPLEVSQVTKITCA